MRVVQFGEGVFLRGMVDLFFQELNEQAGTELRVTLVQPRDADTVARLMSHGGTFPVLRRGLVSGRPRQARKVVECIDAGLNTHTDPRGFELLAKDPQVGVIVSNTTEAGLSWSVDDVLVERHQVRSFPGKLTWFLEERFMAGRDEELHVLPCELVADNGAVLSSLVKAMASAWHLSEEFFRWLEDRVVFHDTLVDCIVTGHPDVGEEAHPFAVAREWFQSWRIAAASWVPSLFPEVARKLGVEFVPDLGGHRELKVRVLNGAHTAMACLGVLSGLGTVAEAVSDPRLGPWLHQLMVQEIEPTLTMEGTDAFVSAVWDRFSNPFVDHRLEAILLNSSAKIPARFQAMVSEQAGQGRSCPGLARAVAAWLELVTSGIAVRDHPEVLRAVRAADLGSAPGVMHVLTKHLTVPGLT